MRWPILVALVVLLVLFQTSIAPVFEVFGVGPNLLLVVLCCIALLRDPEEIVVVAPLAGVGMGLLAFQGLASSVAALAPIAFAAMLWSGQHSLPRWLAVLLLIAFASVAHFGVLAVAVEIETTGVNWVEAVRDVMLPSIVTNVVLGIPVYAAARIVAAPRREAAPI